MTADAAAQGIVENSFLAVAAAHAAGARYVESDCHLTRDGVVVLCHDVDLRRVTGDPRRVDEVSAADLEDILSTRGGLLTLAQALDAFPTLRFNLDVKADAVTGPTGRLIADHTERVLVASFSDARRRATVRAARAAGAKIRPAASAGTATIARVVAAVRLRSPSLLGRALNGIDALQIPERHGRLRILSPSLITAAHRRGVEVHVWTVNDVRDMTRLRTMGVDGIITDRADRALDALRGPR